MNCQLGSKIKIRNRDTNSINCDAIQDGVVEAVGDEDTMARKESFKARPAQRQVAELGEGEAKSRRHVVAKVLDVVGSHGGKVEREDVGVSGREDGESFAVEDLEAEVGGCNAICKEIVAVGSEVCDGGVELLVCDHGGDG